MAKTVSMPPTAVVASVAHATSRATAASTARVAENTVSPSTMMVNRPYRSAMCSRCQLGHDEDPEPDQAPGGRQRQREHPADLHQRHTGGEPQAAAATRRVAARR